MKKKQINVSAEQYGIILSEIILITGDSYHDFCNAIEIKEDYFQYLIYLEYHLYLSKKILEKKYSGQIINVIENSCIESMVNSIEFIKEDSKEKFVNLVKRQYDLIKRKNYNIFTDAGMDKLSKLFEEDFGIIHDIMINHHIKLEFSSFIMYNTDNILDGVSIDEELSNNNDEEHRGENNMEEKNKIYEIEIRDKKKTVELIKKFFKKNNFEKRTCFAELKVGATEDDGQIYTKANEIFTGCNFFYKFENNKLIIKIDNTMGDHEYPLNEKTVKLVDNLVIDLKEINDYDVKDLPAKHELPDANRNKKSIFSILFKK